MHTQSDGFSPTAVAENRRKNTLRALYYYHLQHYTLSAQNSVADGAELRRRIDKSAWAPAARLCEFNFWWNAPPVIYFRQRERSLVRSFVCRAQSVMKLTLPAWERQHEQHRRAGCIRCRCCKSFASRLQ